MCSSILRVFLLNKENSLLLSEQNTVSDINARYLHQKPAADILVFLH